MKLKPHYVLLLGVTLPACLVQTDPLKGDPGPPGPRGETGVQGEPGAPDPAPLAALQSDVANLKILTEQLQKTNTDLQGKLDTLEKQMADPECPSSYTKSPLAAAAFLAESVVCKNGTDEVVRVGRGHSAYWIDRYEATVWDNPDGSGAQRFAATDDTTANFPKNGHVVVPLYALSVAGKLPSSSMTWFQAAEACAASGKRLPTNYEWQLAVSTIVDSGPVDGTINADRRCNTLSLGARSTGNAIGSTRETSCVSRWGAEDMVGNLWEWTADWHAGLGDLTNTAFEGAQMWPDDGAHPYGEDGTWNIASSAYSSEAGVVPSLPAVALRGGGWLTGIRAGAFALSLNNPPSAYAESFGFRCVVTR